MVPKRLVSRYDLILLAMATQFCEVFVPYHRDGVLFAGPRDAFSVGKFISSIFLLSIFDCLILIYFFCRFIVYQYIVSY